MDYIFKDNNFIGLVKDSRLIEIYDCEKSDDIGTIYRARVESVVPSINAAFVDIGEEKNAFLSFIDCKFKYPKVKKINEIIKEGQTILVQKTKEGKGDKGSKVTLDLELKSKYLVLKEGSNRSKISKKIKDNFNLYRLKKFLNTKVKGYSVVVRTDAKTISDVELYSDYINLKNDFDLIKQEINFLPTPKVIYKNPSLLEEMLAKELKVIKLIISNDEEFLQRFNNERSLKLKHIEDFNLKYDKFLYDEFKVALARKVYLKSGASIVIDELESFTAIDVNTEQSVKGKSHSKKSYETNLEAAKEIALQIRLRNISGIILIDFINMYEESNFNKLIDFLTVEFKKDRIQTNIIGFTKLGILEITRERKALSIADMLLINCAKCKGSGKLLI